MVKFIAGIDEAGKGPLIGPLVICVAAIGEHGEQLLIDFGVTDSKLLSEKQREEIFKNIEHELKYELVIIHPEEIDKAVLDKKYNLNWLEADHGAALLNKLDVKLDNEIIKTIIDCPSPNINAYKKYFSEKVDNKEIELIVEHKADLNWRIVGASSIIAKITREIEIEKMKKKLHIDFGSGYPSDPKTKKFVKENYDNPKYSAIFRKSWATYKVFIESKKQSKLEEY
jgi:ribonuclease HII